MFFGSKQGGLSTCLPLTGIRLLNLLSERVLLALGRKRKRRREKEGVGSGRRWTGESWVVFLLAVLRELVCVCVCVCVPSTPFRCVAGWPAREADKQTQRMRKKKDWL